MRKFVRRISAYVRKQRPNFVVIARNGLELINKIGREDPPKSAPARTYLGALDGVLVDSLFYGLPHMGRKSPAKRRKRRLRLAEQAKGDGLRVLVLDHVTRRPDVRKSYRLSAARGYAWFAAYAQGKSLNRIPPYPRRPFNEKAESVLSLRGVRNFLFLEDSAAFGRQDEFTLKLHQTNYDMVVVDVFHAGRPLSKRAIQTLKYKKIGGRRLVLAQMNIGTAASYRYYWKAKWRRGSPVWISAPTPGDPDRYYVEFWRSEWQKVITGDTRSYVYGIIDLGFDGVVLSGLESYRFFQNPNDQGEGR